MQTFNQHLIELVEKDIITKETALQHSPSAEKLNIHFSGLSQHKNKPNLVKVKNKPERQDYFKKKSS